jgi:excisionase family DNA binding protein
MVWQGGITVAKHTEGHQQLDRDLMTRKQAADYLGITPQTVSKLVNEGKLDVWRSSDAPNARMRIKTVSIEKMLEGRRK